MFCCRSSPRIFDNLSQAICWIAHTKYGVQTIFHLLDDFLTVDGADECVGLCTKSACLVFNPIMVDNYAAFFNCTPVGRASDSMMAPT